MRTPPCTACEQMTLDGIRIPSALRVLHNAGCRGEANPPCAVCHRRCQRANDHARDCPRWRPHHGHPRPEAA